MKIKKNRTLNEDDFNFINYRDSSYFIEPFETFDKFINLMLKIINSFENKNKPIVFIWKDEEEFKEDTKFFEFW